MMDLKEIIKWFIPCFHILQIKMDTKMMFICLFLFFNLCASDEVKSVSENSVESTKKLGNSLNNELVFNQRELFNENNEERMSEDITVGRTFGRPFMKKMVGAIMPVIFQVGAASTWAVVAALVGVKTLIVTLLILKLLLMAGAAKIGALFASKSHGHHQEWSPSPHQKEIHLHIHNQHGHENHEEHVPITSWNREGYAAQALNYIYNPYKAQAGPQTISTPFGNYVKIDAT